MLCRPQKHTTGFLVKSFVECYVSTVLTAVKSLYSCSEVCVHVGSVKSRPFTFGVGLRQGCGLLLLLFIVSISGSQTFH